ncbi:MAG: EamA family transporter [Alphaproteobacteria bacterium]|nr:EamA family transporter [Alphaproteobacteria bacterium]
MDLTVFGMVFIAAFLHAVWNALVKIQGDRLVVMALISGSSGLVCLAALPIVGFPEPEAWPYIFLALVLHNAYYLFLVVAYRHGDLSHVYPIARGSAPLAVALISVGLLDETLTRNGMVAVSFIGLGLISLALSRDRRGSFNIRPYAYALGTGLFIALYTVVDGIGARAAGNPHAYTFWLFAIDGLPLPLLVLVLKKRETLKVVKENWRIGLPAGIIALVATWIVIWAMTLAPIAYVSALRETSIVFAVIIGVVFLKERLDIRRLIAIGCAMFGAFLLKAGK